jgi:AraC family ethanolamine operon transcriptional activator
VSAGRLQARGGLRILACLSVSAVRAPHGVATDGAWPQVSILCRWTTPRTLAATPPPRPCRPRPATAARTEDAQAHAASLSAWEQHYEQISAAEGQLEDLSLGALQVFASAATSRCCRRAGAPGCHAGPGRLRAGPGFVLRPPAQRRHADRHPSGGLPAGHRAWHGAGRHQHPVEALQALAARLDGPDAQGRCPRAALRALAAAPGLQELTAAALAIGREHPARLAEPALARNLGLALGEAVLASLRPEHVVGAPRAARPRASASCARASTCRPMPKR